jgi:spore germination protein GerM
MTLPPGERPLLGLTISSGTATVDLSSSFTSRVSPSTMPLRIAQVVYTLAQFPSVTGVQFKVDGPGCRGGYSIPVSYTVTRPEPGTIEVFESSPENGQPVNVQLIPVTLAP